MILNEETKIWIYGYGLRGKMFEKRLAGEGLHVYGYIDRKPEQYEEAGKQQIIIRPEEAKADKDAIVICALSNVFAHEEVAEKLSERGFGYILYKNFYENEAAKKCNILYDDLTMPGGTAKINGRELPAFSEIKSSCGEKNGSSSDTVCVNVPVELLFGLTKELLEESLLDKRAELLKNIPDQSLLYYTLPKGMMQFFLNETDPALWKRCRELWDGCRNAQSFASEKEGSFDAENRKRNIEDRYDIFQKMENLFNENPAFFSENPVSVVWNGEGKFNIQDGNNRAAFLLAKGMHYIRARMSRADYEAWMDMEEQAQQIRDVCSSLEKNLRSPVLHPLLKDIPCTLEFYSHKKAVVFTDWLWRKGIDPAELAVCEYYCENDLFGSHLGRMGANLTVVDTKEQLILHRKLDELYLIKHCCYEEDISGKKDFYIVLTNKTDGLKELVRKDIKAAWYILEYIEEEDTEAQAAMQQFSSQRPEYLMSCLVGNKIYKVAAVKGGV